ncbi:MAG: sensor histidine kinase [Bacteroidales bacterium]|nr:sensor histidine kinase [Bacteroidales bacterium]
MLIFIALSLSVALQLVASIIAVSLIKRTRYNIAWIVLSIGFSIMAFQRIYDLIYMLQLSDEHIDDVPVTSNWISVFVSLLIFVGTLYIKKLFNYLAKVEQLAKQNESMVFSAIVKTEENERQMFAKELHDGLGPILSSVKMAFSALNKDIATDSNKQILLKTNFAIDEAIITVKEISNKLSPHILSNFGLERAIKSFLDTVMIKQNVEVKFDSSLAGTRYDFNIEAVLYRVVCELITNTLRHSAAQNILIQLHQVGDKLLLHYSDDGVGFDINNVPHKGMGLSNMESRVKSINGVISIESSPNNGINVSITVKI